MEKPAILKLDVSRNKAIEFYDEYLIFKGNRIYYADIDGVSYLWTRTRTSVYFIPVGTSNSYEIQIRHQNKVDKINLSGFLTKAAERQGNFTILVRMIEGVMKPNVIINLLKQIKNQGSIKVGNLEINKDGITKSSFFSKDFLGWSDYFNTILDSGNVFIYKDVDGKAKLFNQLSMGNLNAVVLPDLLLILFQNKGNVGQILDNSTDKNEMETEPQEQTENKKVSRKNDVVIYCTQCGNKVAANEKYCGNCGKEIKQ